MKKIDIIAACSDLGVHIDGSNLGPIELLKKINDEAINKISYINYDNSYKKDLDFNNKKKNLEELNKFNSKLYAEITNSINNNSFPITLGGDHSVAIASALSSINKYKNLGIIWFDAHADFHTFQTTESGNIHGLPFAAVTNYEKTLLTSFHSGNYYSYKNAVLLGARSIDEPYELSNLQDAGITIITTNDIKKHGIEAMCDKAFEIANSGTDGIHISYDLDVIDPNLAPGVSVPEKNGIDLDEAYYFIEHVSKNIENIKSFDLVEFNPLNDLNDKTLEIALNIINKLINS